MPSICSTALPRRSTDRCQRSPLPDGGLFDRLVTALEEALAEGAPSGGENLLLKRLRKLKSELDTMG
jgi:hypothetical protein